MIATCAYVSKSTVSTICKEDVCIGAVDVGEPDGARPPGIPIVIYKFDCTVHLKFLYIHILIALVS